MARSRSEHGEISPVLAAIFTASWRLLLILGIAAAGFLFLLAPILVNLLYGPNFAPAIVALRLLACTMIPYALNLYLASRLLAARQERKVTYTFALSLVALAGMNAWLIPRWNIVGASLATLIAEMVQAGIFLSLTNLD
jgi:O-antigen/teichoic acid export membrane protein